MRPMIFTIAVVISGCAAQPRTPAPAAPQPPALREAAVAPAAAPARPTDPEAALAQRVLDAKKRGLTVVNKNGETLYCRTELKTGSHVAKETTCLTGKQLDDLHEQTQQDMVNFQRPLLPRPGK